MKALPQRPEWVRNLESDEEVWAAFQWRRTARALLSPWPPTLDPETAEWLDWLAAERAVGRRVEAHGHWSDEAR